jgi:hypothetical protein
MSDVQATVGANITPFQTKMVQVKAAAKEAGEGLGLEFDRGAQRAESRVERGIDGMLRKVASAKNPIEALGAVVEGVGRSFAIASTAFLAVGIGAAIYEQFTQAKEASDKLEASIAKLGTVDPDNESIHQLQKDIDDFQKVAEQYENRGLLERILFGAQEDADFAHASALNDLKKNLVEIDQIQRGIVKNEVEILKLSSNPDDKKTGEALEKDLSDQDEAKDLKDQLTDQIADRKSKQDALVQFDKKNEFNNEKARDYGLTDDASIVNYRNAREVMVHDLNKADKAIADRQREIAVQAQKSDVDEDKPLEEKKAALLKQQKEADDSLLKKRQDEARKRDQMDRDAAFESADDPGKATILKQNVNQDQDEIDRAKAVVREDTDNPLKDAAEQINKITKEREGIEDLITKKKGDELKLSKLLIDSDKDRAKENERAREEAATPAEKVQLVKQEIVQDQTKINTAQTQLGTDQKAPVEGEEKTRKIAQDRADIEGLILKRKADQASLAEKMVGLQELQERRAALLKEQAEAKSTMTTAKADAMGFHGQVSSLRREGFGKAPTVNPDGSQLKAAQAAVDRLDKIQKGIAELNEKIGGSA